MCTPVRSCVCHTAWRGQHDQQASHSRSAVRNTVPRYSTCFHTAVDEAFSVTLWTPWDGVCLRYCPARWHMDSALPTPGPGPRSRLGGVPRFLQRTMGCQGCRSVLGAVGPRRSITRPGAPFLRLTVHSTACLLKLPLPGPQQQRMRCRSHLPDSRADT